MSLPKPNPVEPPWYVTRMPGGVGGVAPRGVPLSRSMHFIRQKSKLWPEAKPQDVESRSPGVMSNDDHPAEGARAHEARGHAASVI